MTTALKSLNESQQQKLQEVQAQQAKLKNLQADLEKLNVKISHHEKLSTDDTKFISDLGWLSALSVSIASIASSM
jgi:type II secretory pathway component PulM